MNVYRAQPWQQSPQERKYDAQRAYQEYLQQLRQQYENASRGVYNTISEQQANQQLASLGLNFATDAYQQALAQARISGDISELGMRQQQARDNIGAVAASDIGDTTTDFVAIFNAALV